MNLTLRSPIAAGGGIRRVILQSDDLTAEVTAMRSRGVDVSDAIEGGRRTPAGRELWWKTAVLSPGNLLPILFIEHLTPMEERRGAGPFQALYRTTSMGAAARWMQEHGPQPARWAARGDQSNTGQTTFSRWPVHRGRV